MESASLTVPGQGWECPGSKRGASSKCQKSWPGSSPLRGLGGPPVNTPAPSKARRGSWPRAPPGG